MDRMIKEVPSEADADTDKRLPYIVYFHYFKKAEVAAVKIWTVIRNIKMKNY